MNDTTNFKIWLTAITGLFKIQFVFFSSSEYHNCKHFWILEKGIPENDDFGSCVVPGPKTLQRSSTLLRGPRTQDLWRSPRTVLRGPRTMWGPRTLLEGPRPQKPESILKRGFRTQYLRIYENSGELYWRIKDPRLYQEDPLPMSQHQAPYEYS